MNDTPTPPTTRDAEQDLAVCKSGFLNTFAPAFARAAVPYWIAESAAQRQRADDLDRRLAEAEQQRGEWQNDAQRAFAELDSTATENARLAKRLAEVERERDSVVDGVKHAVNVVTNLCDDQEGTELANKLSQLNAHLMGTITDQHGKAYQTDIDESLTENARLAERVRELEEALKPFAKAAKMSAGDGYDSDDCKSTVYPTDDSPFWKWERCWGSAIKFGHIKQAAKALGEEAK